MEMLGGACSHSLNEGRGSQGNRTCWLQGAGRGGCWREELMCLTEWLTGPLKAGGGWTLGLEGRLDTGGVLLSSLTMRQRLRSHSAGMEGRWKIRGWRPGGW